MYSWCIVVNLPILSTICIFWQTKIYVSNHCMYLFSSKITVNYTLYQIKFSWRLKRKSHHLCLKYNANSIFPSKKANGHHIRFTISNLHLFDIPIKFITYKCSNEVGFWHCLKACCWLFSPTTSLMFWKSCMKKTLKLPNKCDTIIVKVWKYNMFHSKDLSTGFASND